MQKIWETLVDIGKRLRVLIAIVTEAYDNLPPSIRLAGFLLAIFCIILILGDLVTRKGSFPAFVAYGFCEA